MPLLAVPSLIRTALQLLLLVSLTSAAVAQTVWRIDNTTNIGGHPVTVLGNPQIIRTPYGQAVRFNGLKDGLMVSHNPVGGMSNLTVELVFKHDPLTVPSAREPRIVHIQSSGPSAAAHRLTLESRVFTNTTPHTFHLDTFLRFAGAKGHNLTLLNDDLPHPVGEWTHMAATFDGTHFCNYVNGQRERCGVLQGAVFTNTGATWIGQRNNNVNHFEGAVLVLRFTPRVLATNEFIQLRNTNLFIP
jgi:hypothetical protein